MVDMTAAVGVISIAYLILVVIAMLAMAFATDGDELHSPLSETEEADGE